MVTMEVRPIYARDTRGRGLHKSAYECVERDGIDGGGRDGQCKRDKIALA